VEPPRRVLGESCGGAGGGEQRFSCARALIQVESDVLSSFQFSPHGGAGVVQVGELQEARRAFSKLQTMTLHEENESDLPRIFFTILV
jgi:hypothetical protein